MLLEYAVKNGAFPLKILIWPTNCLDKCFQDQIQDHFFPPQNYTTFLSCVFLGENASFSIYQRRKIKMALYTHARTHAQGIPELGITLIERTNLSRKILYHFATVNKILVIKDCRIISR